MTVLLPLFVHPLDRDWLPPVREDGPPIPEGLERGGWLRSRSGKRIVQVLAFYPGHSEIYVARPGQDHSAFDFCPQAISVMALWEGKWAPSDPPTRYDLLRTGGLKLG